MSQTYRKDPLPVARTETTSGVDDGDESSQDKPSSESWKAIRELMGEHHIGTWEI